MPAQEDPLRALQWLADQSHRHPGALVGSADVMRALAWGGPRAQVALRQLEADGCITIHALAGQGPFAGHLEVSFRGRMRLAQPVARPRRGIGRPAARSIPVGLPR